MQGLEARNGTLLVLESVDAKLDGVVSQKINYQPHYRTLTDAGKYVGMGVRWDSVLSLSRG